VPVTANLMFFFSLSPQKAVHRHHLGSSPVWGWLTLYDVSYGSSALRGQEKSRQVISFASTWSQLISLGTGTRALWNHESETETGHGSSLPHLRG